MKKQTIKMKLLDTVKRMYVLMSAMLDKQASEAKPGSADIRIRSFV